MVPPGALVHATWCDAGSMPVVGQSDCLSIGWHDCPPNFEPDPSALGAWQIDHARTLVVVRTPAYPQDEPVSGRHDTGDEA